MTSGSMRLNISHDCRRRLPRLSTSSLLWPVGDADILLDIFKGTAVPSDGTLCHEDAASLPTLRAHAPDVGAISRALIQIAERYPRRRRILPPRVVSESAPHGYVPHARVGDFLQPRSPWRAPA
jgi:hypothetical protein